MVRELALSVLVLACTPPARTGASGADAATLGEPASRTGPSSAPPEATSEPDAGGAFSAADCAEILQRTLDLDLLAPYWHAERRGRSPLSLLRSSALCGQPALVCRGVPVVWTSTREREERRLAFEVTRMEVSRERARVEFSYPVEGVVGGAAFERRAGAWVLVDKRVAER